VLTASKATTKKLLKKFARLAYRGDPDRRGVVFWERVAWLLWDSYADLMAVPVGNLLRLASKRESGDAHSR
jgi:hypothetical protein